MLSLHIKEFLVNILVFYSIIELCSENLVKYKSLFYFGTSVITSYIKWVTTSWTQSMVPVLKCNLYIFPISFRL